jgi:murein DD-endopeptidase MepM/ murein hydrolase activator NlpD
MGGAGRLSEPPPFFHPPGRAFLIMNLCLRKRLVLLLPALLLACAGGEERGEEPPSVAADAAAGEVLRESLTVTAGSLHRGETPMGYALRAGLDRNEASAALAALAPYLPARRFRTDDRIELARDEAGHLVRFAVTRRHRERFVAEREEDGWSARPDAPPLRKEILRYEGVIDGSLWESLRSEGASAELVVRFAEIFSWTFDFLTDCRAGDRYAFLVEAYFDGEEISRTGDILVARYEGKRGSVSGVHYEPDGGRASYYAPDGTSLRKIFLRSPLNYRRISSGFSRSRYHPILKYYRPHLGIDYAAARGTPVVTVGDGTVIFAGWKGGFGNYIEVRHSTPTPPATAISPASPRGSGKGRG